MANMNNHIWNLENSLKLERLWRQKDPELTAAQIGMQFGGLSKSAILGRARRQGLPNRDSPIHKRQDHMIPIKVTRMKPKQESGTLSVPDSTKPIFPEFSKHPCSWPIGMPKDQDFHFCGSPALWGRSYCPDHLKIAYVRKCDQGEIDPVMKTA